MEPSCARQPSRDVALEAVAKLIREADYLLIATGAGFSADSGLPVYNDVAKDPLYADLDITYCELADAKLLLENECLFWKFWGDCCDSYESTQPHEGYRILDRWCREKGTSRSSLSRSYVYSSNVDGHFRLYDGINANLCEMHGCVKEAVCSSSTGMMCDDDGSLATRSALCWQEWSARTSDAQKDECRTHELVTAEALRAAEVRCVAMKSHQVPVRVPRCPRCGLPLRPKVVLFDDICPSVARRVKLDTDKYQAWADAMEADLNAKGGKLVVLELGCGLRVPSVRREAEMVVKDLCGEEATLSFRSATLVRINKDFPDISEDLLGVSPGSVGLQGNCVDLLLAIDRLMRREES